MTTQGKGVRPVLMAITALLLLSAFSYSASAVLIDLGSYSVQDPRITVNYTEDIFLLSASLVNLEPTAEVREYTLRQVPAKDPAAPTYIKSYRLYTGTVEDPQYLVSGHYQLTLEAIDRQGKAALDIVEFEITGLDIILLSPRFGFSPTTPFDVSLRTEIAGDGADSSCWYSRAGWDTGRTRIDEESTYTQEHLIEGLSYNGFLYVSCSELSGRETRQRFLVGRDATPPIINASAIPPIVSDPRDKSTIIKVITDDNSTCSIDGEPFPGEDSSRIGTYRKLHEMRMRYEQIADTSLHEIDHRIVCSNLAELETEKTLTVTVNFGAYVGITVLEPTTGFINTSSFTLRIRPTFDATACDVNRQPMQAKPDEEWTAAFTSLPNGKIALNISCSGNNKNATLNHSIFVDTTKPTVGALTTLATFCSNISSTTSAEWNGSDAGGIARFVYGITQGTKSLANGTTVLSRATAPLPRGTNGTMMWSVFAVDLAGNIGIPVTKEAVCGQNATNATSIPPGPIPDPEPNGTPPSTCKNGLLDVGEEDIDCGGSCVACLVCFDDTECGFDEVCGPNGVCVPGGVPEGCFSDFDCASDEQCIAGTCAASSIPIQPLCSSDGECFEGQQCMGGVCVGAGATAKETDWLALSLLILGILIMAGTGWFLYQRNGEKQLMRAREQQAQRVSVRPAGAPQGASQASRTTPPLQQQSPRSTAQNPQRPDRAAQRKEALGAFDEKGSASATKPQSRSVPQKSAKPAKDDDEEVFDDLESIGKK